MQIGSGLTRFKSAPSSYFDTFLNGDDDWEQLLNPRICSPERQRIFARFMSSGDNSPNDNNNNKLQKNSPRNVNLQSESQMSSQFLAPKRDDDDIVEPAVKKRRHQLQRQQSHGFCSVVNRNQIAEVKMESRGLVRHSSSPAGLFDGINTEEIGAMRGMGNFGAGNIANPEASFPSPSRFKNKTDLPPRNPPSAKMAPISGFGSKAIGENRPLDARFDCNFPGFPLNQWDGSILSDDFFNELAEDDIKPFMKTHASYDQKSDGENRPTTRLPHHLSLPKSCSAMEKLLQDSVPCKLRAKRGFATHPRSIAERVRRTKISERIRKLQELVPNMDDQTNTAEMLDLAVDYIKDLQRQVKRLSDNGAKCVCSAMKKS